MTHFIEKCSECDKIISQCRCPDLNKHVRYSICKECQAKPKPQSLAKFVCGLQLEGDEE